MRTHTREERDEARSEDFRCPECEANTGNGKSCADCRRARDERNTSRSAAERSAP